MKSSKDVRIEAVLIPWLHLEKTPLDHVAEGQKYTSPKFYFDTNIIRDIIKRKSHEVLSLYRDIRTKDWACLTSTFALMEFVDVEQADIFARNEFNHGKEYNTVCRSLHNKNLGSDELERVRNDLANNIKTLQHIKRIVPNDHTWELAMDLSLQSNIHAADAMHLAMAVVSGCNFLVTNDQLIIKEANRLIEANLLPPMHVGYTDSVRNKLGAQK